MPTQMNQQAIQQIKNMMNKIKMAQNPQLFLNEMLSSNPQLQQVFNLIKQSGGDPKTTFLNMAQQMGVNPQDVLNQLQ